MTKLLIFLTLPEVIVANYEQALNVLFPDLDIQTVRERQAAAKSIADADILLTFGAMMTDEVVKNAPKLKWIHALGTGLDGIIDLPSLDKGVRISSTRGIHGSSQVGTMAREAPEQQDRGDTRSRPHRGGTRPKMQGLQHDRSRDLFNPAASSGHRSFL
jgi:hypothetical protein